MACELIHVGTDQGLCRIHTMFYYILSPQNRSERKPTRLILSTDSQVVSDGVWQDGHHTLALLQLLGHLHCRSHSCPTGATCRHRHVRGTILYMNAYNQCDHVEVRELV